MILRLGNRIPGSLKLTPGLVAKHHPQKFSYEVRIESPEAFIQSEEGPIVKANKRFALTIGSMEGRLTHTQVVVNGELYKYGVVQTQAVYEPKTNQDIVVYFQTAVQMSLADLPWIVRIYEVE